MLGGGLSEKILYTKIKRRDQEAFLKAYDLYADDIYRFLYFKVGSEEEARDLVSATFLKVWNYIQNNNLKDYKTLKALLYKTARNLAIDYFRTKKDQVGLETEPRVREISDPSQNLLRQTEIAADFAQVLNKINELKNEYREAIILRYINELSIKEISETMNKSRGNVRVLIYRALKALREMIEEE
jgi:RNA polymerase sigma-70 factor (ECF subfamily)